MQRQHFFAETERGEYMKSAGDRLPSSMIEQ
jgi:hypothetical protein